MTYYHSSPMEMSAKRPVSRKRVIVQSEKPKPRDPRFDDLCGHYNEDLFKKSYSFINDYRESELEMIDNHISKASEHSERQDLQLLKSRMKNQMNEDKRTEKRNALKREWKKKELELIEQGKRPFFLKKSMEKKLEMVAKYQQYQDNDVGGGGDKQAALSMNKVLEKHRKRNVSRDLKTKSIPKVRRFS
eukprot:Partr_v1_DN26699_c0_g3_i1_m69043 putative Component of the 90S pre-ribosome involved in the maturation of rRNAs. Required for early cleavages of the pre-RNAs in the 40S ribosomal subunit maturation pathway (By similarity)